mmetsp:Transcript_42456/g.63006  ORF Transcript_42456/g.63006 Transcript_42456/m.63006 type:complete len:303 (-) Transcript_42456:121-1029(-)|eukprot:CAMPEP_0194046872 /NCGR_PEP_ID=MMETSP0009_2-20130614/22759_1 /TAXON_ID=210454 /ORGANISM="Grammatophora oceanica, Strain CCMP 410" /LENGTH=302 /DNA_ID=CAMNT_0038692327 /DNA_START=665 /DNA_END=1573 /DNA_ORIENTATION=+
MMNLPSVLAVATLWLASVAAFMNPPSPVHYAVKPTSSTSTAPFRRRHAFTTTTNLPSSTSSSSAQDNQVGARRFVEEGLRIRRERQQQMRDKSTLRFLYAAATGISIQMATEILISPGKLLPGAVWAALIPFQVHPTVRKTHPKAHKAMGFACFGAAASMAYGLHDILQNGSVFAGSASLQSINVLLLSWFAFTGAKTFQFALGRDDSSLLSRSALARRRWMVRHAGSGLWIALYRMLTSAVGAAAMIPLLLSLERQRSSLLAVATRVGAVATIGAAEYAVSILNRQKHGYRGETVDFDSEE